MVMMMMMIPFGFRNFVCWFGSASLYILLLYFTLLHPTPTEIGIDGGRREPYAARYDRVCTLKIEEDRHRNSERTKNRIRIKEKGEMYSRHRDAYKNVGR